MSGAVRRPRSSAQPVSYESSNLSYSLFCLKYRWRLYRVESTWYGRDISSSVLKLSASMGLDFHKK